jgi:hypothetical protein
MSDSNSRATIQLPEDFFFGELRPDHTKPAPQAVPPPLGPLAAFSGDFAGVGFNTIFRPDSAASPTVLPINPPAVPAHDNILELNLTSETLSFAKDLGAVPNRGTDTQPDITLNGIPYVQQINDITIRGESTPIHFEPGLWMFVPQTVVPNIAATVTRMASIPHGTTIDAQGLVTNPAPGPPNIHSVDITPFVTATNAPVKFPSQTATNGNTLRIPQDLTPLSTRITQAMLDNPNSLLSDQISKQKILTTTTILISTNPAAPLFGGGTANIAFLLGQAAPSPNPNANAVLMTAVFWIETVQEVFTIDHYRVGSPPLLLRATASVPGQRVAHFKVTPPFDIDPAKPRKLTVTFTQIQYSQNVTLNFKGLSWPHVSVNTLVPADPIPVGPTGGVWT